MQPSNWKENMFCVKRTITGIFGRRGQQNCLKASDCIYDISQRSITRYRPWIRGTSHWHRGILMKRMKFSSCLNLKLTCITFFFPWLLLPDTAVLKYLGPKQEQISRGKKAINITNSSQHSFVSWKAQTQQEVLRVAVRWLQYFEIMASGVLSLQTISHVAERPRACVRAPLREAGLTGHRHPFPLWGPPVLVGDLRGWTRVWTRVIKGILPGFLAGLCSSYNFYSSLGLRSCYLLKKSCPLVFFDKIFLNRPFPAAPISGAAERKQTLVKHGSIKL